MVLYMLAILAMGKGWGLSREGNDGLNESIGSAKTAVFNFTIMQEFH